MEKKRCMSCFQEYEGALCPHCGGAQNEEHQLPVGTVLHGRYQIGKVLGQGGFGITYIGWDKLVRVTIAVKEFYPGGIVFRKSAVSTNVECINSSLIPHYTRSKARFLQEANALAKFRSVPEIVNILDFSEENNTAYIIMEYVRGVNLAKYIQLRGGKLSAEETFRILKPVMEALAKVHEAGIVHRDISPDNIILDPMGGAKLLDFGAVRAVEDPDVDKALTQSTVAILKHGFAPIEQYNSRGSLGPWTDEYAMCATIWYCLTGKATEEATIRIAEDIDPDWATIPELPDHQQQVLAKGFSRRAKDRYPSMEDLLEALFPGEDIPVEQPIIREPEKKLAEKTKQVTEEVFPLRKWMKLALVGVVTAVVILAAVPFLPEKQTVPDSILSKETQGADPAPETWLPEQTEPNTPESVPSVPKTEPPTGPLSEEEQCYLLAEQLLAEDKLGEAAIAFGKLAGYSDCRERSFAIWNQILPRNAVCATSYYTVGLRNNGTLLTTDSTNFECDEKEWQDIVRFTIYNGQAVGFKPDGTMVATGSISQIQDWEDIVYITSGAEHTVGLKIDGTVVATGRSDHGMCDVGDWQDIVAVSAGKYHTVGLKADGTVVATSYNYYGLSNVQDWRDIVAVSAGWFHTVGLKADGTVVATGWNVYGTCDVQGWEDIVEISAGRGHTVGLKSDGTVVAVGLANFNECNVQSWKDIIAIDARGNRTTGLKADGTVVAVGSNYYGQCNVQVWTDILIPEKPFPFR